MESNKKCKMTNFSKKEESLLTTLVAKRKDTLECKETDHVANKQKTEKGIQLADVFKSLSGEQHRDHSVFAEEKDCRMGTERGPNIHNKKSIIDIIGRESTYDDDAFKFTLKHTASPEHTEGSKAQLRNDLYNRVGRLCDLKIASATSLRVQMAEKHALKLKIMQEAHNKDMCRKDKTHMMHMKILKAEKELKLQLLKNAQMGK